MCCGRKPCAQTAKRGAMFLAYQLAWRENITLTLLLNISIFVTGHVFVLFISLPVITGVNFFGRVAGSKKCCGFLRVYM